MLLEPATERVLRRGHDGGRAETKCDRWIGSSSAPDQFRTLDRSGKNVREDSQTVLRRGRASLTTSTRSSECDRAIEKPSESAQFGKSKKVGNALKASSKPQPHISCRFGCLTPRVGAGHTRVCPPLPTRIWCWVCGKKQTQVVVISERRTTNSPAYIIPTKPARKQRSNRASSCSRK